MPTWEGRWSCEISLPNNNAHTHTHIHAGFEFVNKKKDLERRESKGTESPLDWQCLDEMDKRVAVLLVAAMALLLNVCEVTCKPIDRIKSKATSVIRTIGLYADPFGWIGKPNWPTRSNRRKKSDGHRYRWFIEIDGIVFILFLSFELKFDRHFFFNSNRF